MEVAADGATQLGDARREGANGARRSDADRVGQDERVRLDLGDPFGDLHDSGGIDLALERAAERDAERHDAADAVAARSCGDAPRRGDRLLDRGALIALVERLGDAEREADLVEAGREEPLVSALVEGEPGTNRAPDRAPSCGDDLLRSRHLRDALRVDEARDLDAGQPGVRESPDELGAHLDVQDLGLVLQPVARPHVVDRHAGRSHEVHL